jgi:signal recognition particle subunit SRP54
MASRILDMGDVLTLIEQAQKAFDAEQTERMAGKLASGEDFTLDDFLMQMQQLRNAGPLKKMLGMLPGMGQMREALDSFDEREVDRIQAIIQSMTPAERGTPKIINGSRRARIARGSGTQPADVNQLLDRFDQAQKMMRQMAKNGGNMPGLGNMPGSGKKARGRQAPPPKKAKGKSGNPALRALQEQQAATRQAAGPAKPAAPGSAFGLGQSKPPAEPGDFDPTSLGKLFGGR